MKTMTQMYFCFQETRCCITRENIIIPGYSSFYNESKLDGVRSSNRYSGTSIYIKDGIECLKVEYSIDDYEDLEGRIIILHLKDKIIINVYSPNSGTNYDNKIRFIEAFEKYLSKQVEKTVIFCGDMNFAVDTWFDIKKAKPGPGIYKHELDFYDYIVSNGYKDTIDKKIDNTIYTWWDPRQKKKMVCL